MGVVRLDWGKGCGGRLELVGVVLEWLMMLFVGVVRADWLEPELEPEDEFMVLEEVVAEDGVGIGGG